VTRWNLLEALGLALVVAFFALLWWPSALLVAGVLLILVAVLGERAAEPTEEGAA
jgi:hypothetical protein